MGEVDREILRQVSLYAFFVWVAVWGGFVRYFQYQKDNKEAFSWMALWVHVLSASFAGLVTALVGKHYGLPFEMIGALSALSGHMGTPLVNGKIIKALLNYKDLK